MKLYTEEHMMAFANWCRIHDSYNRNEVWMIGQLLTKYENTETLFNPIVLPSDEEIDAKFGERITMYDLGYTDGAKWMKEQILNQNK